MLQHFCVKMWSFFVESCDIRNHSFSSQYSTLLYCKWWHWKHTFFNNNKKKLCRSGELILPQIAEEIYTGLQKYQLHLLRHLTY